MAIGTNDIQNYFPFVSAKNELDPTTFILNQIQRDASGKIKLGLDLQGGTSFLVEMDTNYLANEQDKNDTNQVSHAPDVSGALSQAVEVLRKRIDKFGVAEPVIQSAGGNRILIQLPGLSQSDKESAKSQIQKAAYLEFRMVKDDSEEIIAAMKKGEPVAIPPGYEILKQVSQQPNGPPQIEEYVVKKKPEDGLAGDFVKSAWCHARQFGRAADRFHDDRGRRKKICTGHTRQYRPCRMAIVLDGEL